MHYQISRNGQMYGPYTLEDLQRYLASGNILPTDMAKSEEMPDWVPVSQIVAGSAPALDSGLPPSEFTTPSYAGTSSTPVYGGSPAYDQPNPMSALAGSPYPDAPNLHWGLVVLFSFLTCCFGMLFMQIWNLVISLWLRRVQPNAIAAYLYAGVLALTLVYFIIGGAATMSMMSHAGNPGVGMARYGPYVGLRGLLIFVIWVVRLIARFSERASLQEHFNTAEPVGLDLNPVMTFFFGGVYFQYHLNRINAMKQAARYGAGRAV